MFNIAIILVTATFPVLESVAIAVNFSYLIRAFPDKLRHKNLYHEKKEASYRTNKSRYVDTKRNSELLKKAKCKDEQQKSGAGLYNASEEAEIIAFQGGS